MRDDTIVGVATALGRSGIAIVRVSGPEALSICKKIFVSRGEMRSHMLRYGKIHLGEGLRDEAMAVYMAAPNSYTREDVVEFHVHGGRLQANLTVENCIICGARHAQPGEFTRRALINGRIDLMQAEGVMSAINAEGRMALKLAGRQLSGDMSKGLSAQKDALVGAIAQIEAVLDYPDEDIGADSLEELAARIKDMIAQLSAQIDGYGRTRLAVEGMRVVIAGRPNAGKSTLFNVLAGGERAIVTNIPGTTRDVLREKMTLGGVPVTLTDTAGLRASAEAIEKIGVERAMDEIESADIILYVVDDEPEESVREFYAEHKDSKILLIYNKSDSRNITPFSWAINYFVISAMTGQGVGEVVDAIESMAMDADALDGVFLTSSRHLSAAVRAREALVRGLCAMEGGVPADLICIDLREALYALGEIDGSSVDDEVIDRIFSEFCLGK